MRTSTACRDEGAVVSNWQVVHQELSRLARARAGLDFEEGRWLVAAWRSGVHPQLGYGSFVEYVERLFGYGPRLIQDKVRVAEALETLPAMAEGLRSGQVCWSVLRELTRVATPETEAEWLGAARGRTVREVERLVSGHRLGSRPGDTRDAEAIRHVLRFEVSGEVLATFREALAQIRREAGEWLDDDAALLLMARQSLTGPTDEGRASYQVALTVCESCRRGTQQGRGEQVEVRAEMVEMAACDAQRIGQIGTAVIDEAVDAHVGTKPGASHAHDSQATHRATQDIPPAIRRLVLRRDGGCCVFPGCQHATFLDLHHIVTRANGGAHSPDNLICVCGAHHRAIHLGQVFVEGSVATGLQFRHADGSRYGAALAPRIADVQTKAFQALRGLGFREGDVRRALQQPARTGDTGSVELVMRRCLLTLTERTVRTDRICTEAAAAL